MKCMLLLFLTLITKFFAFRYMIVSTGGTATALENAGVSVTKVEQLTSFPEMVSILYDVDNINIHFTFLPNFVNRFDIT